MMRGALDSLRSPDLAEANTEQKWRVFKAENLRIGHMFTRVAVWAELWEAKGVKDAGPMGEVAPMELLEVYERIRQAEDQSARYAILAEPIPEKAQQIADKPLVWLDIIHGLTSPHIVRSIGQAAIELNRKDHWKRALDLGSGTDNVGAVLLGKTDIPRSVESLTAVDRELPLLEVAVHRYPEIDHLAGDVTQLPFSDASFDLITSGGLAYGLEPNDQARFFSEVSRLLIPGGVYLDGDYRHRFLHPDFKNAGPKFHLESFIVCMMSSYRDVMPTQFTKSISEKFDLGLDQGMHEPRDFAPLGLQYATREYRGERPDEITDIRILQKLPPVI